MCYRQRLVEWARCSSGCPTKLSFAQRSNVAYRNIKASFSTGAMSEIGTQNTEIGKITEMLGFTRYATAAMIKAVHATINPMFLIQVVITARRR
jgi:hypothetical protein